MPFPSVSIPLMPLIRATAQLTMDLTDYDAEHSRLCHAVDVLLARVVALCVALVHRYPAARNMRQFRPEYREEDSIAVGAAVELWSEVEMCVRNSFHRAGGLLLMQTKRTRQKRQYRDDAERGFAQSTISWSSLSNPDIRLPSELRRFLLSPHMLRAV
jgi:hypothetical protein